jgi:hypothetical protein
MSRPAGDNPDLDRLTGVVAPEILAAARIASSKLREAGIPHALAGGLAVAAYGYPCTTRVVHFLVGDEAFERHAGGLVTLKLPLIAVGDVRIDFISLTMAGEREELSPAVAEAAESQGIPVVPVAMLITMKLRAGRFKDLADVVELLKRGKLDVPALDRYLSEHAPALTAKWEQAKQSAAREE